MPSRIERRIAAMVVSPTGGQIAVNGWIPFELPVPSNKKWNVNLIFQSSDGAATRNARLALAGGKPAHGLDALAIGPTITSQLFAVSPAGTYVALVFTAATRLELYKRVGTVGLVYIDTLIDAGTGFTNLSFSPDERWLAWTSSGFTNVFATAISDTGFGATTNGAALAALAATSAGGSGPDALAWSPSGAYIAVAATPAAAAGRVSVFPFAAGVFGGRIDAPGMTAAENLYEGGLAFSPDETTLSVVYAVNGGNTGLYGWPFAAGVFGAVNRLLILNGATAGVGFSAQWNPDPAVRLFIATQPVVGGASTIYKWNGAAWAAGGALTGVGDRGHSFRWLSRTLIMHFATTAAGNTSFAIDLINPTTGALVANLQNLAAGLVASPANAAATRVYLVNGMVFRFGAGGGNQIVLETVLQPSIILFPTIGITANNRVQMSGITLEAGDRLLIGTPAATDIFALSGSAIEIG